MAQFKLAFTNEARAQLKRLEDSPALQRRLRSVRKALGLLETNARHPGLQTHKYESLKGPKNEDLFEAYAENETPAAYRIFWYYGPARGRITIVAITPHP